MTSIQRKSQKIFQLRHRSTLWNPDDDARASRWFKTLNPPTPESLEEESAESISAKLGELQEKD